MNQPSLQICFTLIPNNIHFKLAITKKNVSSIVICYYKGITLVQFVDRYNITSVKTTLSIAIYSLLQQQRGRNSL